MANATYEGYRSFLHRKYSNTKVSDPTFSYASPELASGDALYNNNHHLTAFAAKPDVPKLPETAVTRGFEKFAFTKIVRLGTSQKLFCPHLILSSGAGS
jgi:hypothetical protein